jgi:hypothetical protein
MVQIRVWGMLSESSLRLQFRARSSDAMTDGGEGPRGSVLSQPALLTRQVRNP